ncbi:VWA domain-containing protein [Paludibacter sp. 221]|uniref:vWA domain-containing protein n=1 Tax=Paludibacter sp. 221 TaxID=2302939 RepID=UPI0013D321AB|nr:VWA domain-containing protein [Paludibacter sp. 221]NDV47661.1 VWA domain-containing protein [Paludibacter sp. 221]
MTFHNPEYLLFLLVLIPIIFWYVWEMQKSDASLQISSHQDLKQYSKTLKIRLRHLPFALRVLSITFIIIAIARPQKSDSWKTENTEGIDIMMALDISGSMELPDFKPNRLEAAKALGIEFIKSRPNDNMGLVVFAGESFTQCPLTTDHAVLINLFNAVTFGMIEDGTAIGLGLANAVARIKDGPAKSKVIILLTDGSNNRGDITPTTAGEIAQTFGVRVYTIGVGSHGEIRVPYQTPLGTRYQMVDSTFDEEPLKEIAQMTGGVYFRATDNNTLRTIYQQIDELEKSKIRVREFSKKEEAYHIFALLALVFLALEILLRNTVLKSNP